MYKFLKSNLFFVLLSGLLLNIPFFVHNFYGQIFSFFAIIPLFYALPKLEKERAYFYGLVFFGLWLIPTSIWFFKVFPFWIAVASMTFFTLMANVFVVQSLFKNMYLKYVFFIFTWVLISVLRYNLPVTQDWWIPDLYYALSFHPFVLQIIKYFSIFSLIFLILGVNAVLGFLLFKKYYKSFIVCILFTIIIVFSGNYIFIKNSTDGKVGFNLIAIQNLTSGGIDIHANSDDVIFLLNKTKNILKSYDSSKGNNFVLFPENKISENDYGLIKEFAIDNNINVIFNSKQKQDDKFLNSEVFINNLGEIAFVNFKKHIAPGEDGFISKESYNNYVINNKKITTGICYDFHYFDIRDRFKDNDLAFVSVNDAAFGSNMPYFHMSDIVFRAIENNIGILSSSTNAPTFFVDNMGVIRTEVLKPYSDSYVIYKY